MSKGIDCQLFEDQLDTLMEGSLSEDGMAQLHLHAATCSECAMQLRVQEHLALPSLEELEREVPDALVGAMWAGVSDELAVKEAQAVAIVPKLSRTPSHLQRPGTPRMLSWLLPAMAAATVALLFSTGYLFSELNRMKGLEAVLAQQVMEQQQWLAELGSGASNNPVARTAALAGRTPFVRALARQENISITGLQVMLRSLPGDRTLLEASQVEALMENSSLMTPPLWREVLSRIDGDDGIRAQDLLQVLESLDVNPTMTVPTSDLIDLLS